MKSMLIVLLLVTAGMLKINAAGTGLEENRELKDRIALKERELIASQEQNQKLSRERKNLEKVNSLLEQNLQLIEKNLEKEPSSKYDVAANSTEANQGKAGNANIDSSKVIFQEEFDKSDSLNAFDRANQSWNKMIDMPDSGKALCVEVVDKTPNTILLHWFDIKTIAGKKIICSVKVKGDGISKPADHYLGGKFQLAADTANGTKYFDAPVGGGSFDWKDIKFSADIPFDAKSATLQIGLQGVTGKIYFRNLKVTIEE